MTATTIEQARAQLRVGSKVQIIHNSYEGAWGFGMYAEVLEVYEENGILKVRLEGDYRGKLISQIYKVSDVLPPTQPNNLGVVLWGVFDGDKLLAAHPTRKQARRIAKVYGFKTKKIAVSYTVIGKG